MVHSRDIVVQSLTEQFSLFLTHILFSEMAKNNGTRYDLMKATSYFVRVSAVLGRWHDKVSSDVL